MPAFHPIGMLKSLFTGNRPWSHLRPLIKVLRTPPYDRAALEALQEELKWKHEEIPELPLADLAAGGTGAGCLRRCGGGPDG